MTENGYTVVRRTEDHSLYEHHGDRVLVPHHSRDLSPWTARVIEWSLEPRLGREWLTAPSLASAPPVHLWESHPAASFAPRSGDPGRTRLRGVERVRGRGAAHRHVRREPRRDPTRAADAAAAWFADTADIELEPRLQLDPVAQRWLDHATRPTRSPERMAEARRHLGLVGLARDDITALLDWSPIDGEAR